MKVWKWKDDLENKTSRSFNVFTAKIQGNSLTFPIVSQLFNWAQKLSPTPSPPRLLISPPPQETSTTSLVSIFSSILNRSWADQKNSIIKEWEYWSREFLKAIFFSTKNIKKADRLCMKFSSTPNTSVQQMPHPPFSKLTPPYFVTPSFSKNISTPRSGSTKCLTNIVPIPP